MLLAGRFDEIAAAGERRRLAMRAGTVMPAPTDCSAISI
jgi:hypothetical protein